MNDQYVRFRKGKPWHIEGPGNRTLCGHRVPVGRPGTLLSAGVLHGICVGCAKVRAAANG